MRKSQIKSESVMFRLVDGKLGSGRNVRMTVGVERSGGVYIVRRMESVKKASQKSTGHVIKKSADGLMR